MDETGKNFLDKNTLIAIVLTMLIWVGWSKYMASKYPNMGVESAKPAQASVSGETIEGATTTVEAGKAPESMAKFDEIPAQELQVETFDFEEISFSVVSKGMGLTNLVLKQFKDRNNQPIRLSAEDASFASFASQWKGSGQLLDFKLKRLSETEIVGVGQLNGVEYEKKFVVNPKTYSIDASIAVKAEQSLPELQTLLVEKAMAPGEGSLFAPSMEKQEVVVLHREGSEREIFSNKEPFAGEYRASFLAALSSHYFALAIVDASEIIPNFAVNFDSKTENTIGSLSYPSFAGSKSLQLSYKMFFGPKDISTLRAVNENLAQLVDFGMFSFLAEPLLDLMKWFYGFLSNWGLAIIALTILVRLVVLPFNLMSYKSMAKMQAIQPLLKKIREKHKEDPVKMNQEVMAIMKREQVNPAGGCLPMLLQFPIFIALYRVLSEAIDLYQAPFGLWITDLSLKDPYYVLPVLMGVSMYLQQKITPSTMDPQQQKIMAMMPIVFSLLMVSLPSGLTLYIFVSTIFGVLQQQLFMKKPSV